MLAVATSDFCLFLNMYKNLLYCSWIGKKYTDLLTLRPKVPPQVLRPIHLYQSSLQLRETLPNNQLIWNNFIRYGQPKLVRLVYHHWRGYPETPLFHFDFHFAPRPPNCPSS